MLYTRNEQWDTHELQSSGWNRIPKGLGTTDTKHELFGLDIRGRSDKYLAYKRKTKILEKRHFISQHSLNIGLCLNSVKHCSEVLSLLSGVIKRDTHRADSFLMPNISCRI